MPNEKLNPKISGKINEINSLKSFIEYARFVLFRVALLKSRPSVFEKRVGVHQIYPENEMIKKSWMDKIQCLFDLVLSWFLIHLFLCTFWTCSFHWQDSASISVYICSKTWMHQCCYTTVHTWYKLEFLAHLSWKLKWAFLITCRPASVCPSVRLSVCL